MRRGLRQRHTLHGLRLAETNQRRIVGWILPCAVPRDATDGAARLHDRPDSQEFLQQRDGLQQPHGRLALLQEERGSQVQLPAALSQLHEPGHLPAQAVQLDRLEMCQAAAALAAPAPADADMLLPRWVSVP